MALTPERKAVVDAQSDDELELEVQKANRSRFQGDLYDYAVVALRRREQAKEAAQAETAAATQARYLEADRAVAVESVQIAREVLGVTKDGVEATKDGGRATWFNGRVAGLGVLAALLIFALGYWWAH